MTIEILRVLTVGRRALNAPLLSHRDQKGGQLSLAIKGTRSRDQFDQQIWEVGQTLGNRPVCVVLCSRLDAAPFHLRDHGCELEISAIIV